MYDSKYLQRLGLSGISEQIEREFEEMDFTDIGSIGEYVECLRSVTLKFPQGWQFSLYDIFNSRRLFYGTQYPDPVSENTILLSTPKFSDCVGLGFEINEEDNQIIIEHVQTPSNIKYEDVLKIRNELPVHPFELTVAGCVTFFKPLIKQRNDIGIWMTNLGSYLDDKECHHKRRMKSLEDRFFTKRPRGKGLIPLNPNKKRVQELVGDILY